MLLSKQIFTLSNTIKNDCFIYEKINEKNYKEFWFEAKDIAEFLEYKNTNDAIINFVRNEWKYKWSELIKIHRWR